MTAPRADVPAMLREMWNPAGFVRGEDAWKLAGVLPLLAAYAAAADAMRGGSVVVTCGEWARLCEAYDDARAALAAALEGGSNA